MVHAIAYVIIAIFRKRPLYARITFFSLDQAGASGSSNKEKEHESTYLF